MKPRPLIAACAGLACAVTPLAAVRAQTAAAPVVAALPAACAPAVSDGLRNLSDAYLTASDRVVLAAALRGERAARACGDEVDAVSFEIIAADAYGDDKQPAQECAALRDAARRASRFEGTVLVARAKRIRAAADSCRKV